MARQSDERDEKIAALEASLASIQAQLNAGAVNAVEAVQQREQKEKLAAIQAEIEKGNQARSQEECDRQFEGGRHRWKCVLPDGNGHPELIVSADNDTDAVARYLKVCGVTSHEKQVVVSRA